MVVPPRRQRNEAGRGGEGRLQAHINNDDGDAQGNAPSPPFHPLHPSSSNCLNCCTEYPRVVFPSPASRYTRTRTCTHTHMLTSRARARARASETELCVCVLVGLVHVAVGYINLLLSFFLVGRDIPCATMIGRLAERSALICSLSSIAASFALSFICSFVRACVCTLGRWR